MGNGALFFLSALGAFNGLVLGIYFLLFSRKRKLSNYFLGGLLIALSLRIGKSVLYYFDTALMQIYLQIGLSACWFIGPFLYYYVRSENGKIRRVPVKWALTLASLLAVILTVGVLVPYHQYPLIWNKYIVQLIYTQWGIFLVLSSIEVWGVVKKLPHPLQLKSFESGLIAMLAINLMLFVCYVWALLGHSGRVYISAAVIFTIVLYAGALVLFHKRRRDDLFSPPPAKYANRKIKEDDAQMLLQRLDRVMAEKRIFKNPNLKLSDLAREVNISAHQLSQLLNDSLGKGFALYVNEFRIREACTMLSAPDNLTVEAIGEEVGFNSKSTFFSTFKKLKGTTPAMFQQNLEKVSY